MQQNDVLQTIDCICVVRVVCRCVWHGPSVSTVVKYCPSVV